MFFFKKNKSQNNFQSQKGELKDEEDKIVQLHLDVHQTMDTFTIYGQVSGADMTDVKVSIEGEADIVIIEGKRTRPERMSSARQKKAGTFVVTECVWGDFYRRIILPERVKVDQANAKIKNGVLILSLPFERTDRQNNVKLKVNSEEVGLGVKSPRRSKKLKI